MNQFLPHQVIEISGDDVGESVIKIGKFPTLGLKNIRIIRRNYDEVT